jgi:hypothetical protein
MVAATSAGAAQKSTVAGADGNEATDDGGGAFGECTQAPELNGEEAVAEDQEESSDGAEEPAGDENLGRDCSNEESVDPNADYN